MKKEFKKQITEALIDQKEIFGDDLFTESLKKTNSKAKIIVDKKEIFEIEIIKKKQAAEEADTFFEDENDAWEKASTLDELESLIKNCSKCPLWESRTNFVFGTGDPKAKIMCIGEGPGAEEDKQGKPFVGRAGQLLTDILKAIKFTREEVYIANVLKSRPPGNRTPLPQEMEMCMPYLLKQIELIKPKLILCLGLTAAQALLRKKESMGNLRGKLFEFNGSKVMVTYHPAALLRNPNLKKDCWEDVKKFRKLYDEMN
ncbi:MAG TPA: uracil-DNA glycosylase [Ignavibacteriaceae bacterium]|nr:uracil-DNA glycosylase [Ignavibacteriaceae bacterium]